MAVHRTPHEVANIIEKFLDGTGGDWEWDDFTSLRIKDPALEAIRIKCAAAILGSRIGRSLGRLEPERESEPPQTRGTRDRTIRE